MLFNSFDFGVFLILVYLLYWGIGTSRRTGQNVLLLVASYVFYGLWDWRFLFLILASSLIDFYAAKAITSSKTNSSKKIYLWVSILWNLGVLFVFKYYNFFLESFVSLFSLNVPEDGFMVWNIIIPIGLSFYTFQTMSYTIDVYKKETSASNNLIEFLCFVSFFPQLVAGPIERAKKLLPQFRREKKFNLEDSKNGLRQILWGLFKKMVIADNVAIVVNAIYASPEDFGSLTLLYATSLFFFQIYCDFSGYSDIAIGTAKLFGFKLSKNFNIPYLASSGRDFWRRWHITLTKWFMDYVYAPLVKGNKQNNYIKTVALFITMTLIGFWHGANWTFIAFGLVQAIIIAFESVPLSRSSKRTLGSYLNKAPKLISTFYIFLLITISSVFFRANSVESAFTILKQIFSFVPSEGFSLVIGWKVIVIPILIFTEVMTRKKAFPMLNLEKHLSRPIRWILYYSIILLLIRYAGPKEQFIYFQF